ncbi:hypothetical protein EG329_002483 [Mollisiaceae sp. DMI_Dod_QoI]|nr:hypothetical protein EG329_002483 [Helotiales sp. DMI_Dod_QoI]
MEGLIERANALFQELALSPNNLYLHNLHCRRISRYSDSHVHPEERDITCPRGAPPDGCLDRVVAWTLEPPPSRKGSKLVGTLRLVILARDKHQAIGIHAGTFVYLFKQFGIDPYIKYLVARSVDGFYSPPPSVDGSAAAASRSFYLGIRDSHMLVWSCTGTTVNAIVICQPKEVAVFGREASVLESLVGHPAMPLVACCGHIVQDVDAFIEVTLSAVKAVEASTRFSPDAKLHRVTKAEKDLDLGEMSGWMSEASVKLAQYSNHLTLVATVLKIEDSGISTAFHPHHTGIMDVSRIFVETSKMTLGFVQYLAKRVETQHTVLANLIAREEAKAAFQLAKDSNRVAEATARDGFAMMTIAMMTMFFLPATFFATIFAMPILGWDAESGSAMMMPQMWLYIELAVPVTTAIFLLWLALTW